MSVQEFKTRQLVPPDSRTDWSLAHGPTDPF